LLRFLLEILLHLLLPSLLLLGLLRVGFTGSRLDALSGCQSDDEAARPNGHGAATLQERDPEQVAASVGQHRPIAGRVGDGGVTIPAYHPERAPAV
jgi:hypothetical protein